MATNTPNPLDARKTLIASIAQRQQVQNDLAQHLQTRSNAISTSHKKIVEKEFAKIQFGRNTSGAKHGNPFLSDDD
jgi:hypothetical protein